MIRDEQSNQLVAKRGSVVGGNQPPAEEEKLDDSFE